jgi:uncharacterized protein YdaU (DUF1376 family)
MWRSGGELPDDASKLARIAGMTGARWAKTADDIMGFFTVADGVVTHGRVQKEIEKYQRTSDKRAESGARGGNAKALKTKETALANASVLPEQKPTNSEPEPDTTEANTSVVVALPPAKQPRRSRVCPASFQPSPEDIQVGYSEGLTSGEIEREISKFRDFEFRDPHGDWSRTLRTWLRKAAERKAQNERPRNDPKFTAYAERLSDIGAAMGQAVELSTRRVGVGSG